MATWAMKQRYAWIKARAEAGESFTRADIVKAFTVTQQTASATLREFQSIYPNVIRYCASRKAFVRADLGAPAKDELGRRDASGLLDALRRLVFAARTTGGTAGPDEGLMKACAEAEAAIAKATGAA